MIVSLLACGFHFPVDAYHSFFEEKLIEVGRLILDLPNSHASKKMKTLEKLGPIKILPKERNRQRIMLMRAN